MKRKPSAPKRRRTEIRDYDTQDTSDMIDIAKPLTLKQIGIELPRVLPPRSCRFDSPRHCSTS